MGRFVTATNRLLADVAADFSCFEKSI